MHASAAIAVDRLTVTPALCQRCGACCSAVVDGELVACRHLDTSAGFRCAIYPTRPQVCREYSCLRDGQIVSTAVAARVEAAISVGMQQVEVKRG